MATTGNLAQQLAAVADGLGPVLMPADQRDRLVDLCALVRIATGAASVSVARLHDDELVYEAADGTGAEAITGVRLPTSRGIAGYVARMGQSLVVDQVQSDPRFARDVAERVGYIPTSLLVVPATDGDDAVLGVVSVLDRTHGAGDALAVASAAARVATPLLAAGNAVARLGPLLVRALSDAVQSDPRFARDVAERVGYIPTSLLVVPATDGDDAVLGVVSVLDRTHGAGDALAVASAAARVAAPLLAAGNAVARLGPLLVRALSDAVQSEERTLAAALRRLADRVPEPDEDLAELAALMAAMRALPPAQQAGVARVVREALALATPRRRW